MDENETINEIAVWLYGIADNMESAAKELDRERMERETCRVHPYCNRRADLMREAADMRNLADRIKAAHAREVSKAAEEAASKEILNRDAKDAAEYAAQALGTPDARGNVAAMRETLELLNNKGYIGLDGAFHVPLEDASERIRAALAAPPRNCDNGDDLWDADEALQSAVDKWNRRAEGGAK